MTDHSKIIRPIEEFISKISFDIGHKDLILTRCMNESWFSNTLAWLLDPKGSHGFGVSFAEEFVRTIARIRSSDKEKYIQRGSSLRWGKAGAGALSTGFSLKNASVIREFYLTREISKRLGRGPRYCDIVFMDLDSRDGLFVVIENKLFSTNHPFQLEEYLKAVENKFKRAKIREYVYLTMIGAKPIPYQEKVPKEFRYWIRMSWTKHILRIIEKLCDGREHDEVKLVKRLLRLFDEVGNHSIHSKLKRFRKLLITVAAECLLEELNRLGKGRRGEWKLGRSKGRRVTLIHSSTPKSPLYIEFLPNFAITVQSRRRGRPLLEKIIVPYGANSDQVFNLLDIAARDIYHHAFTKTGIYLGDKRRKRKTRTSKKSKYKAVFDFVYDNQHLLRILFIYSDETWAAQVRQVEEECTQQEEDKAA